MELWVDNTGKISKKSTNEMYEKLTFALKQLNAEINRRYGTATQEELDFLAQNPTIDLDELGLDTNGTT